jgi:hypothetical protein
MTMTLFLGLGCVGLGGVLLTIGFVADWLLNRPR